MWVWVCGPTLFLVSAAPPGVVFWNLPHRSTWQSIEIRISPRRGVSLQPPTRRNGRVFHEIFRVPKCAPFAPSESGGFFFFKFGAVVFHWSGQVGHTVGHVTCSLFTERPAFDPIRTWDVSRASGAKIWISFFGAKFEIFQFAGHQLDFGWN